MSKRNGAGRALWAMVAIPFKLACIGLMILLPLLGVWVASSLAVFRNQSLGWAIGAGLLMFPLAPLMWEGFAHWRRKRKSRVGQRFLNFFDRMILRTVTLNALFIGVLLAANPQAGFTALSARGDWMLADRSGPRVAQIRRGLFRAADTLEWLYKLSKDNPYDKYKDQRDRQPEPPPQGRASRDDVRDDDAARRQDTGRQDGTTRPADEKPGWPEPASPHPLARSIPGTEEQSPERVGSYLAARIADPRERARAIHDYVARRVSYDVPAYHSGNLPPQDAATVFRSGKGVCAGYAKLFEAISRAAGLEAAYLVGDVRSEDGGVDGVGHAWNAVKIGERWHLVDVTWDAGHVDGDRFTRRLSTVYFLTPPKVFSADHFPEDPKWQLRDQPLTRGEFIRQPMMRPAFYAQGLGLHHPDRSHVSVVNILSIGVTNPRGLFILAKVTPEGGGPQADCAVERERVTTALCRFPAAGSYEVKLFTSPRQYGTYGYVGKVIANASP